MSINVKKNTTYLSAAGTAFAVTLAMSPTASANAVDSANPFMVAELGNGYMVAEASEGKDSEEKVGEGNGADEKGKEGDCSAKKDKADKDGEGKCGEGKCASG